MELPELRPRVIGATDTGWLIRGELPLRFREAAEVIRRAKAYDGLVGLIKDFQWLYDQRALGPLDAAAQYGPDYEPPTDKQCLEIRTRIEQALKGANQ